MIHEVATEADRQLGEQRGIAEALATRASLMVGVAGAVLAIAATRATLATDPKLGHWMVALAALIGVVIFWAARVGVGPSPTLLATVTSDELAQAKLLLVESNSRVLLRVQVLFTVQVLLSIGGVAALAVMMWGLP